jgi:hypothetical protein
MSSSVRCDKCGAETTEGGWVSRRENAEGEDNPNGLAAATGGAEGSTTSGVSRGREEAFGSSTSEYDDKI